MEAVTREGRKCLHVKTEISLNLTKHDRLYGRILQYRPPHDPSANEIGSTNTTEEQLCTEVPVISCILDFGKSREVSLKVQTQIPGTRFSKSPETYRARFGWHNSLCIFKTKASRGTKLCSFFQLFSFYNIWKYQLCGISGSEFYEWLVRPEKFRDVRETGHWTELFDGLALTTVNSHAAVL